MEPVTINLWGVLAATAFSMIVGAVWYGPLLGKEWMKLVNKTQEDLSKSGGQIYLVTMLCWLLVSYVLALFVQYVAADTWVEGAVTGFWIWAGFIFPTHVIHTLFAGRSKKLVAIDLGYTLVAMIGMGIILVALPN
ncbi:DUF1761 domain-containing protein [bacterium]|nr:DUF1761 domain-containing protein [bacterium]